MSCSKEEFRVSSLPAKARARFAQGALFWQLAAQEAIKGGIRNLNDLTNLVFFMHHPELVKNGVGFPLGKKGAAKKALRREWIAFRTLVKPIVDASPITPAEPSSTTDLAPKNLKWGVPGGKISDPFYRSKAEARQLFGKPGRVDGDRYGIDVTGSNAGRASRTLHDLRRGLPVYATIKPAIPINDLNVVRVTWDRERTKHGRGPDRFFGFAFVNAVHDRGRVQRLVGQAVEEFGFVGIKLHRYDVLISREVCEVARAFSLPVIYGVMGAVSVCELLAEEYPDVNFIIPHLGSFADDWRPQVALIDPLVRHPNIYTDTAGVCRFDILEQAVQRAGARKILFGSDGPWLHPGVELAKVRALELSRSDETLVLSENFLRLIENAGRLGHAMNRHELAHSAPARRLAVRTMERGDPWLQEEVPG